MNNLCLFVMILTIFLCHMTVIKLQCKERVKLTAAAPDLVHSSFFPCTCCVIVFGVTAKSLLQNRDSLGINFTRGSFVSLSNLRQQWTFWSRTNISMYREIIFVSTVSPSQNNCVNVLKSGNFMTS